MAERKYRCKVKCYYLARLWKPGVPGSVDPDELITDRDDVPLDWFEPVTPTRKAHPTKPPLKKPPVKKG